jgi:site-specific recombinase XerD
MLKSIANPEGFIFCTRAGKTFSSHALAKLVTKIVKCAGITEKKLGAYIYHHTSASLVARETRSALVVKALLNHDKIETSELYTHNVESELAQEISPLDLTEKFIRSNLQNNAD